MKKLKTFFYSFKRSAFDISYYKDILKVPFSFSFMYLYALIFFITIIHSIRFAVPVAVFIPQIPQAVEKLKMSAQKAYPAELEVNINNGVLSTNVQEPYYIDIPEVKDAKAEHFITIDTKADIGDYPTYQTVILVTKNAVVYPDKDRSNLSTYRVSSLNDLDKPITINKSVYDSLFKTVSPYLNYISAVVIGFIIFLLLIWPFIGALFIVGWKMFYLLFITGILWLVAKVFKTNLGYKKVYQLAMHALTLPILVTVLLSFFSIEIPFLYTAGLLLWMVMILSRMSKVHG